MEKNRLERISACTLGRIFAYEPKTARSIIDALGSARAVFEMDRESLRCLSGPYSRLPDLLTDDAQQESERTLERLQARGFDFVGITEDGYPPLLKECEDAPAGLYVRASKPLGEILEKRALVSVVGTRDISAYGREWCEKIVKALARTSSKPMIVSGFAIGVDITAQLAAVAAGLGTVAVLPTGIEDVYPRRHSAVAEKIASRDDCALITDFPPGTVPQQFHFLRRNRIIAGMSRGTILIESKIRGGGMMTARLASDYGRTVLALPGRIDDLRSEGCNALIQQKVAEPLTELGLLSEQLSLGRWAGNPASDLEGEVRRCFAATENPRRLALLQKLAITISQSRGISLEELSERFAEEGEPLTVPISLLEAEGFVSVDLAGRCRILR